MHLQPSKASPRQQAKEEVQGVKKEGGQVGVLLPLGILPIGGPRFKVSPGVAQGSHAEIAQPGSAVTWIFPVPSGMGEKKPVFSPRVSGRVTGGRGCSHGRVRVERGEASILER